MEKAWSLGIAHLDPSPNHLWLFNQRSLLIHVAQSLSPSLKTRRIVLMVIAALSTLANRQKEPTCPSAQKGIKKMWYLHVKERYSASKKKSIPNTCCYQEEPQGQHAK